ncbi:hypothetical protein B0A48_12153 [Cryoendolithus antarcticus]|uniref:Extracellular mutant protein 11 C-terminal domain-containing protein n=1 Tax=Cryoendolithus antarcticus TaxID=1507870 RepID=A0A1V8STV3_9PEZI|nr:hypothetical protein B0A48_12153 [Cryoendolithus antarcticus]
MAGLNTYMGAKHAPELHAADPRIQLGDLKVATRPEKSRGGKGGKKRDSTHHKSSNRPRSRQEDPGWDTDASEADHRSTHASVRGAQAQPPSDFQDSDMLEADFQHTLEKANPKRGIDKTIKGDSMPTYSDGALTVVSHGEELNKTMQQPHDSQRLSMAPPSANPDRVTTALNHRTTRSLRPQNQSSHAQQQTQGQYLANQTTLQDEGHVKAAQTSDFVDPAGFSFKPAKQTKDTNVQSRKPNPKKAELQRNLVQDSETSSHTVQVRPAPQQSGHNAMAPAPVERVTSRPPREQMVANPSRPQTAAVSESANAKQERQAVPLFNARTRSPIPLPNAPEHSSDDYDSDEQPDEAQDSDLDHLPGDLVKMDYSDVKAEPFDKAPNVEDFIVHDTPESANLAEKLSAILGQTDNGNISDEVYRYRTQFMASLTIDKWEEAGAWLVQHFGTVLQNFTGVRREKRRAAVAFEAEIEGRDNAVGAKRQQIKGALDEMKVNGSAVLGTTPKKGRKEPQA